ncbi:hypothetical protein HBI32_142690 [Parastagonospora nodorum]|nr:hypothetical protein HBI32_142690 [Parastagonospora nodorum]
MLVLIKRRLYPCAPIRELVQPKHEIRGLENSASTSLLVYSNYALQECSLLNIYSDLQTHIIRQARIEVTAAYALNYLELQVLKLTLIGTVLYNAIKEYYDDRIRKTIYFYSYTIENNYYNNDVDNILIKYTDNKQQQYNTLIEDYNCAEKQEDNILTIDKCRTSHSNKKDIEADEREDEFAILAEEYMIDNRIIHALALTKDE